MEQSIDHFIESLDRNIEEMKLCCEEFDILDREKCERIQERIINKEKKEETELN